jgi:hypothetical protein
MSPDSIKQKFHERPPSRQIEREQAQASLADTGGRSLLEVSFYRALYTADRVE